MRKELMVGIIVLMTAGTSILSSVTSVQAFTKENRMIGYQSETVGSDGIVFSGKTVYVDDNNTNGPWDGSPEHPYRYLQDGVNASRSGDTVYVFSGTYSCSNITMNRKSIQLLGENQDTTFFYGYISISHAHAFRISGLTFRSYPVSVNWEDFLYISSCVRFTITNDTFEIVGAQKTEVFAIAITQSSGWVISHNMFRNVGNGLADWIEAVTVFNYRIEENTFVSKFFDYAIMVALTAGGTIRGNRLISTLASPADTGINVGTSVFVNISDNYINFTRAGITVGGNPFLTRKILVMNNTLINCHDGGIALISTSDSIVTKNYVSGGQESILLLFLCERNLIYKNAFENTYTPIYGAVMIEAGSCLNRVIANQISGNVYGVWIAPTAPDFPQPLNRFHLNNFERNYRDGIDYYLSLWYKPTGLFHGVGNYWDNYTGVDKNGDGIGDTPYTIPGYERKDRYPLIKPVDIKNVTECDEEVSISMRTMNRGATTYDVALLKQLVKILPQTVLKPQSLKAMLLQENNRISRRVVTSGSRTLDMIFNRMRNF
jgi:parallel beta-helix repeat protein